MSLPSLKPEKTASGIIVDPRTLERVIPQSRRSDGTVRKEQKVRPGFTPQEDVGRFRSTRQTVEDVKSASRPTIPGSNRIGPQMKPSKETENVFASEPKEKTKAQIKNEKRREKRREKVSVNWDEDDVGINDEDEDGDLGEDFKQVDKDRKSKSNSIKNTNTDTITEQGAEQNFPPISGNGGIPEESITDVLNNKNKNTEIKQQSELTNTNLNSNSDSPKIEAALEPTPPAPSSIHPETASELPHNDTTNENGKPSLVDDRQKEISQKPHPIQGGRKGPIGLANPPPIEEPKPATPSRSDGSDDWRTVSNNKGLNNRGNARGGGRGGSRGGARGGRGGVGKPQNGRQQSQSQVQPTPEPQQPRERKEHKIRQGGANDISSLASRVRNLVVANTVGNSTKEKEKKDESKTTSA
ncbi:uncharacterized protein L201_005821 [Kwoniella dendrophila CBS 6074]|uniref:WIBG Mago-binding domain-containing protein n=1 Tax=Kwoniella dendrophila CBS 6074 TaxID=1295534 RepID=A0AAX4K0E0_9TREE